MDRLAARSHQLAAKATDEGRLADEIVGVTVKSKKDETVVEADEAIRPDTTVEVLAKLPAMFKRGRDPHRRQRAGRQRRRRRRRARLGGVGRARGPRADREDPRLRDRRRRLPLSRAHAGKGGAAGAREDRQEPRGRRPVGDQRGVRLRRAQLRADARSRRGQGQRQRRRDRARASDRRVGRAASSAPSSTSCAAAAAGSDVAAICSGGGQGDAIVLEVNGRRVRPPRRSSPRANAGNERTSNRVNARGILRSRPDPDGGVERHALRARGLSHRDGRRARS